MKEQKTKVEQKDIFMLFVGGVADGKFLKVQESFESVNLLDSNNTRHCYNRISFGRFGDEVVGFYLLDGVNPLESLSDIFIYYAVAKTSVQQDEKPSILVPDFTKIDSRISLEGVKAGK